MNIIAGALRSAQLKAASVLMEEGPGMALIRIDATLVGGRLLQHMCGNAASTGPK